MERRGRGTNDQQGWEGMDLEMNKMLGEFRKESYSAKYQEFPHFMRPDGLFSPKLPKI